MARANDSVDYVTCACGKRGYRSRKDARKASRTISIRGVSAYRCPHPRAHPVFYWHLGHLPQATKDGRKDRAELGVPAPRRPQKFHSHRGVEPPCPTPT